MIELAGRFVSKHEGWSHDQSSCDADPLQLSSREICHPVPQSAVESDLRQGLTGSLAGFRSSRPSSEQSEGDVLFGCSCSQHIDRLEDPRVQSGAKPSANPLRGWSDLVVQTDRSARWLDEQSDDREESRLAGARWTHESDGFTSSDRQVDRVEYEAPRSVSVRYAIEAESGGDRRGTHEQSTSWSTSDGLTSISSPPWRPDATSA